MTELKNTIVRRGGVTAKCWYETISQVELNAAKELRITFSMSSKGGGQTNVQLEIQPADFSKIIEAMCKIDREVMLEAMSIELTKQLASPSARYQAFERNGELRVYNAARANAFAKPRGDREKELMIFNAVSDIVYPPEEAAHQ